MERAGVLRFAILTLAFLTRNPTLRADDQNDLLAAYVRASELVKAGKYAEAVVPAERAAQLAPRVLGENHHNTALSLTLLAQIYNELSRYPEAEGLIRRTLRIWESLPDSDHELTAILLRKLGNISEIQHKFQEAEQCYQRSLRIYEKQAGAESSPVARALHRIGLFYRSQGRYGEAEAALLRSVRILEQVHGKNHLEVTRSLQTLAGVFAYQQKYDEAEKLFLRNLDILEDAPSVDESRIGDAVVDLGVLYKRLERVEDAKVLFTRGLRIREKVHGKEHQDVAFVLWHLAGVCADLNEDREAETHYLRCLQIQEKLLGKEHWRVAGTLTSLANLYRKQGKDRQALRLHQRSLAICEKVLSPDHPDLAAALTNLIALHASQGNYAEAKQLVSRREQATRTYLLRELPALTPQEQRIFLDADRSKSFRDALSLACCCWAKERSLRDASAEWLLNGKAIALEAQTLQARFHRDIADPQGQAILAELASLRRHEARLALQADDPGKAEAVRTQRAELQARRVELEKRLAPRGGAAASLSSLWIELTTLRKALPSNAVLVDIARFEPYRFGARNDEPFLDPNRYVAWVVPPTGKGEIQLIDLGDAQVIDAAVAQVRKSLESAPATLRTQGEIEAEKAVRASLAQLAKRVLEPLRPYLDRSPRWVISPDGALWLAPWAALPLDDKTYAVEKHSIQIVVSGRDLIPAQPFPGDTTAPVIFADPDFDGTVGALADGTRGLSKDLKLGSIPRLPGTATEAEAVAGNLARVFGAAPRIFTEEKATGAAFLGLKRPRALTLATHGFFLSDRKLEEGERARTLSSLPSTPKTVREDPLLRCGLLLAGCNKPGEAGRAGVLTGHEILSADLRGCELVVLSACETGLGDVQQGEGVAGLRQAFQLAGAESVLASLWKVPDEETTLQMIGFMNALAAGKDRGEALADAQRDRISRRRDRFGAAHPFNWAAFSLTGRAR